MFSLSSSARLICVWDGKSTVYIVLYSLMVLLHFWMSHSPIHTLTAETAVQDANCITQITTSSGVLWGSVSRPGTLWQADSRSWVSFHRSGWRTLLFVLSGTSKQKTWCHFKLEYKWNVACPSGNGRDMHPQEQNLAPLGTSVKAISWKWSLPAGMLLKMDLHVHCCLGTTTQLVKALQLIGRPRGRLGK